MKTEIENNTTKMAALETKLQEVRAHSIANEQYTYTICSTKTNVRIFGLREHTGENCANKVFDLVREKKSSKTMKVGVVMLATVHC